MRWFKFVGTLFNVALVSMSDWEPFALQFTCYDLAVRNVFDASA